MPNDASGLPNAFNKVNGTLLMFFLGFLRRLDRATARRFVISGAL